MFDFKNIICKKCGVINDTDAKFCQKCGIDLTNIDNILKPIEPKKFGIIKYRTVSKILIILAALGLTVMPFMSVSIEGEAAPPLGIFVFVMTILKFNIFPWITLICIIVSFFKLLGRSSSEKVAYFSGVGAVSLLIFGLTRNSYFSSYVVKLYKSEYGRTMSDEIARQITECDIYIGFYIALFCLIATAVLCFLDRNTVKVMHGVYVRRDEFNFY